MTCSLCHWPIRGIASERPTETHKKFGTTVDFIFSTVCSIWITISKQFQFGSPRLPFWTFHKLYTKDCLSRFSITGDFIGYPHICVHIAFCKTHDISTWSRRSPRKALTPVITEIYITSAGRIHEFCTLQYIIRSVKNHHHCLS